MQSANEYMKLYEYQVEVICPNHSDPIFLNLFSSIITDFNISSALRWAIQDQWSSGMSRGMLSTSVSQKSQRYPIHERICKIFKICVAASEMIEKSFWNHNKWTCLCLQTVKFYLSTFFSPYSLNVTSNANSIDPNQRPCSVASDQGLLIFSDINFRGPAA